MLNIKIYAKMKAIKSKNEMIKLSLTKREIIVICTALCHYDLELLKKNDLEGYFESSELYSALFEYQL